MADIGLNQNITIRSRQFHFQTATNIEDGIIRTEVFEKGRLLYAQDHKYERRESESPEGGELRMQLTLDQFHKRIISRLKKVFEISEIIADIEHPVSHYRIGAIFLSLHIFDKTEQHLNKSIELNPKYYGAHIALARSYFYKKEYTRAEELLQSLVKSGIKYPDLYNLLGLVMLEQKNYIQSLNHLREAIKLNPKYKEAYFNIAAAIFKRIGYLKTQNKQEDMQKNSEFLNIILSRLQKVGDEEDQFMIENIKKSFQGKNFGKIQTLIYDYRHRLFYQRIHPEILGYEFYLWLRYLPDRLDFEQLLYFEENFTKTLANNADYADMWNYLALIHVLLCRDYFLKGLNNFKEATRINPKFTRAKNNLRLVENDGREFLSLIKAIAK
jgi:tetratricopeptide (TPR) repeat protein